MTEQINSEKIKVSMDFEQEDIGNIDLLAQARNTTRTESVRGAIVSEVYLRALMGTGELFFRADGDIWLQRVELKGEPIPLPSDKSLLDRIKSSLRIGYTGHMLKS